MMDAETVMRHTPLSQWDRVPTYTRKKFLIYKGRRFWGGSAWRVAIPVPNSEQKVVVYFSNRAVAKAALAIEFGS